MISLIRNFFLKRRLAKAQRENAALKAVLPSLQGLCYQARSRKAWQNTNATRKRMAVYG